MDLSFNQVVTMDTIPYALAFVLAYLFGSIPVGLILTKLFLKKDVRDIGSGNIGATNVLRTGNKTLAAATLLFDFLKVFLPLAFFIYYPENYPPTLKGALGAGFFGILGHCFPVWLKFKGGKGVATTFGVLFAAVPWAGFIAAVTWGIVAGFSRYSSLAALCAIGFTPVVTLIYYGPAPAIITVLVAVLVFWRHKENIKRLTDETEPKIGAKKETDEPAADTE